MVHVACQLMVVGGVIVSRRYDSLRCTSENALRVALRACPDASPRLVNIRPS